MKKLFIMLSCVLVLAACGGSGSTSPQSSVVSGTASEGDPIVGSVTLKDSKGASKTGSINATTGAYSIVVDGMTAPFILKAGNYYSVVNSATTANINPFTDVCAKAAVGSAAVDAIFSAPMQQLSTLTTLTTKLPGIVSDLKASLDALYPSSVTASQRDFMNGSLIIDQGVDLVLSKVTIDSTSGFIVKYGSLVLVSVTVVNNVVTVTPNQDTVASLKSYILTVTGDASTPVTFSTSDLAGTWYFYQLIADSTNSEWARATLAINTTALATISNGTNSGGGTGQTGTWQLAISADGTVSDPADTSTKMFMSTDKKLIVGTGGTPNDKSLYVIVKGGSGFVQSDLQGSWRMQHFQLQGTSGTVLSNKWGQANVAINNLGLATTSSAVESSGAGVITKSTSSFNLALNSQGIATVTGFPSFYGVLSTDKNLMTAVYTNSDGSIALDFFVRTGGSTFSLADMQGSWKTNYLMLNDFQWGRALTAFDTLGNLTISSMVQSNGVIAGTVTGSFPTMSSGGLFTASGEWGTTFSGIMALNKSLMIATVTQDPIDNPTPSLFIWMK